MLILPLLAFAHPVNASNVLHACVLSDQIEALVSLISSTHAITDAPMFWHGAYYLLLTTYH